MFQAIKYHWHLYKLNKKADEIQNCYKKLKEKAKGDEYQSLQTEEGSEICPILDEISILKSKRFIQIANRLLVPLPEQSNDDFWDKTPYVNRRYLTDRGIWEIKKFIHEEKRQRRERFVVWIAFLTGITGVIGAITGLAAVLSR